MSAQGKATGLAHSAEDMQIRMLLAERDSHKAQAEINYAALVAKEADYVAAVKAYAALLAERDALRARVAVLEGALTAVLDQVESEGRDTGMGDAFSAARAALAGKGEAWRHDSPEADAARDENTGPAMRA